MDVKCERCNTEYEFDDALVSGRGTTVRCTQCGHQFKVHKSGTESFEREASTDAEAADKWTVQTALGPELTFLTLRELRRAILTKRVVRSDLLSRNGSPPRSLGSIAELEPLFEGRASSQMPQPSTEGVAAQLPVAATPVLMAVNDAPPEPMQRTAPWGGEIQTSAPYSPGVEAAAARAPDTLRPPATASAAPPPPLVSSLRPSPSAFSSPVGHGEMTSSEGTPHPQRSWGSVRPRVAPGDDDAQDIRAPLHSSSDEAYGVPRRRGVGGWVVALALVLAVGAAGWVVARPYLVTRAGGPAVPLDARAETLLTRGEQAVADGDLDLAQEQFDKASALSEHDPRVLRARAQVAVAKADIPWLRMRLLSPGATEEARTTRAQLDERTARARAAADDAVTATPDDPGAVRSKLDALRMLDQKDLARSYVTKIIGQASQPETAYVLAALDLAEAAPVWTTVLDRLRLAAGAEGNAGRARAALVYALARAGKPGEAKTELAKLDTLARPYPLSPDLHSFVDRATAASASAAPLAAPTSDAASTGIPRAEPPPRVTPAATRAAAPGSNGGVPGDAPSAMKAASRAINRGDWPRARQIYEAIVARNPNDSEALAGIGDVARAQGDMTGAIVAYKRTLAVNPSFLPALLGLADTQWMSGDRAGSARTYKNLVDHFPEGTYPTYVKGRSEMAAPPGVTPVTTEAVAPDPSDKSRSQPPTERDAEGI